MSNPVKKQTAILPYHLEAICQTIASTTDGLTGTEIRKILNDCEITDTDPGMTKWKRLYNAFIHSQNHHQCSNYVLKFLSHAMQPSRYVGNDNLFHFRMNELNKRLSFIGLELSEKAQYKLVNKATTLSEAQQRASHFKYKLEMRNAHPTIIKYCDEELLKENYFHSIFEAVKSIADRIRTMTGLYADGNQLIDVAFSTGNPLIRINLMQNDTQRSEHIGLSNLIKGILGLIRNPTAHTPKIKFVIEEDEALDIMTTVSYIHKLLDKAI
ncbi:MAG TPA: TIGR02391 family protein [Mucilaginibacter sp.]|nr:TIGR02391 family protein [Mucilaginibacter sp.]